MKAALSFCAPLCAPLCALPILLGGCQASVSPASTPQVLAAAPASPGVPASLASGPFERVAQIAGEGQTAEIVVASPDGKALLYTDSTGGNVGFVDVRDPALPKPGGLLKVGGEPTSLGVTRDGRWGLACIHATEAGQKSNIAVFELATRRIVRRIELGGQPDCLKVSADNRYAVLAIENERPDMDRPMPQAPAGFVAIVDLQGTPDKWKLREVALKNLPIRFPTDPEPEYVAINARNEAAVSLQENNGVVIVDLKSGRLLGSWSCGTAQHAADLTNDGRIDFSETLKARREPDSLAWTPGGHILTANEGDYDLDEKDFRAGSRGITIFDGGGKVLWDSANQLDEAAAQAGSYKDKRSPKRGCEPEGAEIGVFGSKAYAFVGCERAAGIAVFDLSDESRPRLAQWLSSGENPEGLAAIPARNLLVSANEGDNTLSIFQWK